MASDPNDRAGQVKLLADAVGQADGAYTAIYDEPAMRVTTIDEKFAELLYDFGVRLPPTPSSRTATDPTGGEA